MQEIWYEFKSKSREKKTGNFSSENHFCFFQLKMTPLHWAVEGDYPNLVKILLKYRADPNAESKHCETPISIALEMGLDDIYQMLNTHQNHMHVSPEEQQEATDSLLIEMEKDNMDLNTESCDDISFSPDMSNSSQSRKSFRFDSSEAI